MNATITVSYGPHAKTIVLDKDELSGDRDGHRYLTNASKAFISASVERALIELTKEQ